MSRTWSGEGPVTLPPRGVAYGAGTVVALLAVVGIGLGVRAAWREGPAPGLGSEQATRDDAVAATPIVELPPPVTAPAEPKEEAQNQVAATDRGSPRDIAEQTAEAQAVQAKPSKPSQDIDDILTSASEKPPAPAKPSADEAPPEKSDVPF